MTPGTDLASRWLGGSVIAASDESFGEKENLLNPAPAAFEPGHYGPRGEIVDGWETRRRRSPGHDWTLIRLGAPGIITSVDVDTSFFTGNFPQAVSLEACGCEGYPSPGELGGAGWEPVVPRSALKGDTRNHFQVSNDRRFTHVRLAAYPDGGLSRVRLIGHLTPQARRADGYRRLNSLPAPQAVQCLTATGLDPASAADLTSRRPLTEAAPHRALTTLLEGNPYPA